MYLFFYLSPDGCYRRSARPLTTPPPEPDINIEIPETEETHRKPCYDLEKAEKNCLHGGRCFAIQSFDPLSGEDVRLLGCQ